MFPFTGVNLVQATATGKQMKEIMKILQGGSRGFYQTSGFKQIVNNNPHNLLSIKLSDDSDLVDDKNYIFVTT